MITALVDIGNTTITAQVLKNTTVMSSFMVGRSNHAINHFFKTPIINQYIVSSVVPELTQKITAINHSSIHCLTHADFSELTNHVTPPNSVGIDRLVNAYAVFKTIQTNALIIDVGTAVTFCKVSATGDYYGGVIVPGFSMIRQALYDHTSQLPLVQFPTTAPSVLGTSTPSAIESGLFYGAIHMINGIQERIKSEAPITTTILTGGIPSALLNHINHDQFIPDLQFKGLKLKINQ